MTTPVEFTSQSPRFGLPLLFAGQAQKEFFVNEVTSRTDMLMHAAVEGTASTPPAEASQGECWRVGENASGEWAGQEGHLASYQAGTWLYATPIDGMRVLDRSTMQDMVFRGGWLKAGKVAAPTGGATIDVEARAAIAQLIEALVVSGILPQGGISE